MGTHSLGVILALLGVAQVALAAEAFDPARLKP